MGIEPRTLFLTHDARRNKRKETTWCANLSLCVCVCVCVCAYTHAYARIRVSLRVFLLAQNLLSFVSRGKVGERSRFCSLFLIDRLWSLAPKKRPRNKSRKLSSFVRSFVLLSFVNLRTVSLLFFSLQKSNPIQSNHPKNRRERAKEFYRRSRKSSTRTSTSEAWWTSTPRRKIRKSLRSGQSCWRFLFLW